MFLARAQNPPFLLLHVENKKPLFYYKSVFVLPAKVAGPLWALHMMQGENYLHKQKREPNEWSTKLYSTKTDPPINASHLFTSNLGSGN